MKFNDQTIIILVCIFVLITIAIIVLLPPKQTVAPDKQHIESPEVTCIMVTGKNAHRNTLAKISVKNFYEQTYPFKRLIILNHGTKPVLHTSNEHSITHNCFEFFITKSDGNGVTLGDMRNMTLDMVPINSFFFTWDDDDYREPTLLAKLVEQAQHRHADLVAITNRYEANISNNFVWKTQLKIGFAHFLARRTNAIRYLPKDTMEDLEIISSYIKHNLNVVALDNDPKLYIRIVHNDNTSLYVNPQKYSVRRDISKASVYQEYNVIDQERKYVLDNIEQYASASKMHG